MGAGRVEILGAPVDMVDWAETLRRIEFEFLLGSEPKTVVAVNPEKIIRAQSDPALMQFLRNASLLIPDGIGVVMAARLLGYGKIERVPGSELMPRICEIAERTGHPIFLLGASAEVSERVASVLSTRYPRLRIGGRHDGYFTDEQTDKIVQMINSSGARILFLALGSPKQELWMQECLTRLPGIRICQGVGGTFDVIAGKVKRAPPLFLRLHLEWLYRLLSQPRRLLRQTALPRFAIQLLKNVFSNKDTHKPNRAAVGDK
ncbi:MAG: N-acetylglucosaminyldiphosphoundecaprenol N-acetyl-beta-D-mannosaminyltransferase [Gammaproteobacteria bacterium]|nr:N-acetylglucosaminyldiphosphoundecaprenol N-acetyl-beta-D-mannosaminyltransferase [Gammaproteobacteria bacterium]